MDDQQKSGVSGCESVRSWIIEQPFDRLCPIQDDGIKDHIHTCRDCQGFLDLCLGMAQAVQETGVSEPDPGIHLHLIETMTRTPRKWKQGPGLLIPRMRNLLYVRVPFYQAVLGIVLAFLLVRALPTLSGEQTGIDPKARVIDDTAWVRPAAVIDSSGLRDSLRVGRNMEEDSLFLRFIYSTQ